MDAKKYKIQAWPRWIAGNHTFYFRKTWLFLDGGGDDKKITENVCKDREKDKKITLSIIHVGKQSDFVWEIL